MDTDYQAITNILLGLLGAGGVGSGVLASRKASKSCDDCPQHSGLEAQIKNQEADIETLRKDHLRAREELKESIKELKKDFKDTTNQLKQDIINHINLLSSLRETNYDRRDILRRPEIIDPPD